MLHSLTEFQKCSLKETVGENVSASEFKFVEKKVEIVFGQCREKFNSL